MHLYCTVTAIRSGKKLLNSCLMFTSQIYPCPLRLTAHNTLYAQVLQLSRLSTSVRSYFFAFLYAMELRMKEARLSTTVCSYGSRLNVVENFSTNGVIVVFPLSKT